MFCRLKMKLKCKQMKINFFNLVADGKEKIQTNIDLVLLLVIALC